jgi:hypothetical protein
MTVEIAAWNVLTRMRAADPETPTTVDEIRDRLEAGEVLFTPAAWFQRASVNGDH